MLGPAALVWLRGLALLVGCAAVGAVVGRLAEGRREPWMSLLRGLFPFGWAPAALLAAGLAFAALLHPLVLALQLTVLFVLARAGAGYGVTWAPPSFAVAEGARAPSPRRWLFLVMGLLGAVALGLVLQRPLVPLYWDEYVWLGKARLAARGAYVLREAALDPASTLVPPGYPLLWPLAVGELTAHHDDVAALVAGGRIVLLVTAAAFAQEARATAGATPRPGLSLAAMGLVLAAAPLVFVHARAVYVDLPTGLLAGALALRLARTAAADGESASAPLPSTLAAVAYGLALTGLKDEGIVHAMALFCGPALLAAKRRSPRLAIAVAVPAATALLLFGAWRGLLAVHGVVDEDHALGLAALGSAPMLARVWLAHLLNLRSWGLLWPFVLGGALAAALRGSSPGRAGLSRLLFAFLALDVGALFLGVVTCPERVHEFAAEGTLVGRLLVQHAPLAAAGLGLALAEAASPLRRPA